MLENSSGIKCSGGQQDQSSWAILAGLRFFLAVVVVLGHSCSLIGGRQDWTYIGLWLSQGSAVFGFFILSGYSIAASLERDSTNFYYRRFARIWPLYITCIAFGLSVSLRIQYGFTWPTGIYLAPISLFSVIASILMLQTIMAPAIPIAGQIWSLSPEWWHYMAAPALRKLSTFSLVAFLLISFAAFMTIPPPPGGGAEGFSHGLGLVTLSWLWMTGFIYGRLGSSPYGTALLIFPSVFALFFGHFTGAPLFITIFILLLCTELKIPARFQNILNLGGDFSYPLYLFHVPAMVLLVTLGVKNTTALVILVLIIAVSMFYCVDYPCRIYFRKRASLRTN